MRKVEITATIKTTPNKVIAAFTEFDMLKEWWGVQRILIEKRNGGPYTLTWNISDKGFGFVSAGMIKEYKPDETLMIENFVYMNPDKALLGPMTLTVNAKSRGNMTEMYLCQDGYQSGGDWDWYFDAVSKAWPAVANTLKEYLERK